MPIFGGKKKQDVPTGAAARTTQILHLNGGTIRPDASKLSLANQGVSFLPLWLGTIRTLTTLQLRGNTLSELPESCAELAALTFLDLQSNRFSVLPAWLGKLVELTKLRLEENELVSLPTSIGALTKLRFLYAAHNRMTALPDELGALVALEELDVSHNALTALPASLGGSAGNNGSSKPGCSSLRVLYAGHNALLSISASLGSLGVLEELDLSYNQLSSLPPVVDGAAAAIVHLSSLTRLLLRKNRLAELAEDMASLHALTSLDLAHNALSALPEGLCELPALTDLDLLDNSLEALPESIGRLAALRHLEASANQLSAVPRSVSQLGALVYLGLADNKLTRLPENLPELPRLLTLNILRNDIDVFPHTIDRLRSLQALEIDGNLLPDPPMDAESVQDELRFYATHARKDMVFNHNARLVVLGKAGGGKTTLVRSLLKAAAEASGQPKSVPAADGKATVGMELSSMTLGGSKSSGGEGASGGGGGGDIGSNGRSNGRRGSHGGSADSGRNSTNNGRFQSRSSSNGRRSPPPPPPSEDDVPVELSVWDLSGHPTYASLCQQACGDRGSLYMIVLDASKAADEHYEESLGCWLDRLQASAPGAAVLLVLTQCDRLGSSGGGGGGLRQAAAKQCEWIEERVTRHQRSQEARCTGEPVLRVLNQASDGGEKRPLIVCVTGKGDSSSIRSLLTALETNVCGTASVLPRVNSTISKPTQAAVAMLGALRDGQSPIVAVKAVVAKGPASAVTAARQHAASAEQLRALWLDSIAPAIAPMVADADVLADALSLMASQGLLHVSAGVAHLDPAYVIRHAAPFLDPSLERGMLMGLVVRHLAKGAASERLTPASRALVFGGKVPPEGQRLLEGAVRLAECGELAEELLPLLWTPSGMMGLWPPTGLSPDGYFGVLRALIDAGVLWLAGHSPHGRRWLVPSRLPLARPDAAIDKLWGTDVDDGASSTTQLTLCYALGPFVPPGMLSRVLTLCATLGHPKQCWRSGAVLAGIYDSQLIILVEVRRVGDAAVDVTDAHNGSADGSAPQYELLLSVRAATAETVWPALHALRDRAELALSDAPGLGAVGRLHCPHCQAHGAAQSPSNSWPLAPLPAAVPGQLVCEVCRQVTESQPPAEEGGKLQSAAMPKLELRIPPPGRETTAGPHAAVEQRFASRQIVYGEPVEVAIGVHGLVGMSRKGLLEKMNVGALEIEREITAYAKSEQAKARGHTERDKNGWTAIDWVQYLRSNPASELDMHEGLRDKGHGGKRLADFAAHPTAKAAELSEAQCLALRLHTTSVLELINGPLKEGCSAERPHPLPTVVGHLFTALLALRGAATELPDKGQGFLFRAMPDLELGLASDFVRRGGVELGFASCASDRNLAIREASRGGCDSLVLLKLRLDNLHYAAPDLSWCAVFKKETEFHNAIRQHVYPPLTHYRPIVNYAQPAPLEEKKKGAAGKEVTVRIVEAVACLPSVAASAD